MLPLPHQVDDTEVVSLTYELLVEPHQLTDNQAVPFVAPDPAQPELCQHGTVQASGYAYAQLVRCTGSGTPAQQQIEWLTSEDLNESMAGSTLYSR